MPEVIFTGPAGRLEGRFQPAKRRNGPIAIILHPHPQFGGTMNNQVVYQLFYMFAKRGFAVLRFNFRGVGRSQGEFDHGSGELSDAAAALDWVQSMHPEARSCWVAGFSFGAWIGMQLLMRRPEVEGFISIAPPANLHDFTFLAPCPSSGLIIHGDQDKVVPQKDVQALVDKLKSQKGITIDQQIVRGANHFFEDHVDELVELVRRLRRQASGDGRHRRFQRAANERAAGPIRRPERRLLGLVALFQRVEARLQLVDARIKHLQAGDVGVPLDPHVARDRRQPESECAGLQSAGDARHGADHGVRPDGHVVGNPAAGPEQHTVADGDAAGDADQPGDQAGFADDDVVADLDLIVDLGAVADAGLAQRRPVDGRAGSRSRRRCR